MDRRKSLKSILLGGVAGGLALHGCKTESEAGMEEVFKLFGGKTREEIAAAMARRQSHIETKHWSEVYVSI